MILSYVADPVDTSFIRLRTMLLMTSPLGIPWFQRYMADLPYMYEPIDALYLKLTKPREYKHAWDYCPLSRPLFINAEKQWRQVKRCRRYGLIEESLTLLDIYCVDYRALALSIRASDPVNFNNDTSVHTLYLRNVMCVLGQLEHRLHKERNPLY
jgi:hypothetical protein